jgi:hypothetical protein
MSIAVPIINQVDFIATRLKEIEEERRCSMQAARLPGGDDPGQTQDKNDAASTGASNGIATNGIAPNGVATVWGNRRR